MKCSHTKILHLKFSFVALPKFAIFAKFSKKTCLIIFIDALTLRYQRYTVTISFFDNVIRILGIPSSRIVLFMGS